jgi:GNAT superfamily N-acetyltransferase
MDRRTTLDIVRKTLAADCACQPDDWQREAVTIVEMREVEGRRRFPFLPNNFTMKTMGRGAVISCSANRLAWAREQLASQTKDELFSVSTFVLIADFVAKAGQKLLGPALSYVCSDESFRAAPVPKGFTLELFGRERIVEAYQYTDFRYALSYWLDHPRPDMVAVAAWHKGQVVGMAGACADSEFIWQVGNNVLPEYQGIGIGKALVSRTTEVVLEHGKVPHYSTWVANVASSNTAHSAGYWLAWTDVYVHDL